MHVARKMKQGRFKRLCQQLLRYPSIRYFHLSKHGFRTLGQFLNRLVTASYHVWFLRRYRINLLAEVNLVNFARSLCWQKFWRWKLFQKVVDKKSIFDNQFEKKTEPQDDIEIWRDWGSAMRIFQRNFRKSLIFKLRSYGRSESDLRSMSVLWVPPITSSQSRQLLEKFGFWNAFTVI